MNCMKCGVEIEAGQVFCQECLAKMADCPIEPGTVIQLPRMQAAPAAKKLPHRRAPSAEEQVKILKKRVRILAIGWLITLALLAALAYPAISHLMEDKLLPGQNYSSVSSTKPNVSHETFASAATE